MRIFWPSSSSSRVLSLHQEPELHHTHKHFVTKFIGKLFYDFFLINKAKQRKNNESAKFFLPTEKKHPHISIEFDYKLIEIKFNFMEREERENF